VNFFILKNLLNCFKESEIKSTKIDEDFWTVYIASFVERHKEHKVKHQWFKFGWLSLDKLLIDFFYRKIYANS